MKTTKQHLGFTKTAIALAVLAAFNPAFAEDAEISQFIKPESSVSVGVGGVSGDSKDRAIFGQYNGMRKNSVYGLIDFDYLNRDEDTGTWLTLRGQNLGLGTRELSFSREKQGDWKLSAEYSELERNYIRTINTGMIGAGTTTPTIVRLATPGTGKDVDLKTERKAASLGIEKWLLPSLQFEANFKNEEKTGARLWGRGYACAAYVCSGNTNTAASSAILLVPEPIDSVTKQIEAKLNFHTDQLLVTAGYYGTFYNNYNGNLRPTVPNVFNNGLGQPVAGFVAVPSTVIAGGGTSLQNVMQSPMALPPDNQAHQIYLTGNYSFSPTTKANFKYSYTHATQDDNFASMGFTGPTGVSNLNGRVDTQLVQAGFTARPIEKLSLLGSLRYEQKDDKTPTAPYNVEATANSPAPPSFRNAGTFWENSNTSTTKFAAKLEGSYRLPADFRGTIGVDYNSLKREVPLDIATDKVAGLTELREKNWETGYRLELRRSMSETLNGGVSYLNSKRTGSDWTSLSTLDPANPALTAAQRQLVNLYCGGRACYGQQMPASSIIGLNATSPFVYSMTDIDREKWKLFGDWNPVDRLAVQFSIESGSDKNVAPFNPVAGGKGWRDSSSRLYSLDASFALNDNWKLTAYASRGDQTLHIDHSTGYKSDLNNIDDTIGFGVIGKPSGRLEVGADMLFLRDVNKYGLAASTSTGGTLPGPLTIVPASQNNLNQAIIGLPDVTYRQITLKLFAKYALEKNADLRVDLIHQRVKLSEWQWGNNSTPFVYADNTTVNLNPDQKVTFVGVTYIYKFQ
jgi:MtrB/PioB family decaheme-associated outer membrane protein